MILDTSAIVAIFQNEPEAESFAHRIHNADRCAISAANYVELAIVVALQGGADAGRHLDTFFRRARIVMEPVTVEQAHLARAAFLDCGKGRHPAGLNFGDCFAYALARVSGEPLLFKGQDLASTDVLTAV
jgi:ribonuclease VapC